MQLVRLSWAIRRVPCLQCCGSATACRQVFQELVRLGSVEQQALLTKQLDDLQGPISFCRYLLTPAFGL